MVSHVDILTVVRLKWGAPVLYERLAACDARAGYYTCNPGLTMNGSLSPRKVMPGGARRSYHRFRRTFKERDEMDHNR